MYKELHRRVVRQYSSIIVFVFFLICMGIFIPNFLTMGNILNIFRQISINGLIAFGMTLVILTAGIDLSVGAILAFSSAIAALLLQAQLPPLLVFFLALCVGGLVGAANGVVIAYGRIQPFIATLSTMTIFRGLTLVVTQGRPVSIANTGKLFMVLGNGYFLGIPVPIFILFFGFILLWFLLQKTVAGKHVYALGGNARASYLAGIKNNFMQILVYALSGVFSSIAGLILISRLNSAQPVLGVGFELDAIAAVVIGGTRLSGGRGRIAGTLLGILIIGVLNNGLNLVGVSSFYQQVVKGLVILAAVLLDFKKR